MVARRVHADGYEVPRGSTLQAPARSHGTEQDGGPDGLAVRARGLVKRYAEVVAVDGIDLDVPVGTSFGILGPNGAGKTTAMKMITCVLPPTAGTVEVLGQDTRRDPRGLKRRIGVVPQGVTLDSDLKVRENLVVHARYHGIPRRVAEQRADDLLAFAELSERSEAAVAYHPTVR